MGKFKARFLYRKERLPSGIGFFDSSFGRVPNSKTKKIVLSVLSERPHLMKSFLHSNNNTFPRSAQETTRAFANNRLFFSAFEIRNGNSERGVTRSNLVIKKIRKWLKLNYRCPHSKNSKSS